MAGLAVANLFLALVISSTLAEEVKVDEDLKVDIVAPWPSVPQQPFLEAAEFLAGENEEYYWKFIDEIVTSSMFPNEEELETIGTSFPIALGLASRILELEDLGSADVTKLLELELSLGTHAVAIEQQRTLGAQLWQNFWESHLSSGMGDCDPDEAWVAFTHEPGLNVVFCDASSLESYLGLEETPSKGWKGAMRGADLEVFPGTDRIRRMSKERNKSRILDTAILHGVPSTKSFRDMYLVLNSDKLLGGFHQLVVRFYPTPTRKGAQQTTNVRGFGVTMDIKNMEYITVDVQGDNDDGTGQLESDDEKVSASPSDIDAEDQVGGILFKTFLEKYGSDAESVEDILEFRKTLLEENSDGEWGSSNHAIKQFKVWELQELGAKATMNILNSKDPLNRFVDIVSNFPTRARAVSKTNVKQKVKNVLQIAHNVFGENKQDLLLVNGVNVKLQGESFNLFELLETVRKEQKITHLIQKLQLGSDITDRIFAASNIPTGSSDAFQETPRVNIRKGAKGAIIFLNNIEKDATYASWSPQVRNLLVPNQVASVRKNVFTSIVVLDPGTPAGRGLLLKLLFFLQMGIPVRIGLVMTSPALVRQAQDHIADGQSVADLLSSDAVGRKEPLRPYDGGEECEAECLIQLYLLARQNTDAHGGETFLAHITQGRQPSNPNARPETLGPISKDEACELYGRTMVAVAGAWSSQSHAEAAKGILSDPSKADFARAGVLKMAHYVANRGMPLPSWSVNGLVYPGAKGVDSVIQEKLFEEQQRLGTEVRAGRVKDNTDILKYVLTKAKALDKYSASVLRPDEEKVYVPLLPDVRAGLRAAASHRGIEDVWYFQPGGGASTSTVTVWLFADFTRRSDVLMVIDAIKVVSRLYLEQGDSKLCERPLARLAILPVGTSPTQVGSFVEGAANDSSPWVVWDAMNTFFKRLNETNAAWTEELEASIVEFLTQSITQQSFSIKSAESKSTVLQSVVNNYDVVGLNSRLAKLSGEVHDMFAVSSSRFLSSLDSSARSIIANGRYVTDVVNASDMETLIKVEHRKHGKRICEALKDNVTSDLLAAAASVRGLYYSDSRQSKLPDPELLKVLTPITYTSPGASSALDLTAIVDPLSEQSQRLAPVLELLHNALGAKVTVIFVPSSNLSEFPLPNFFRFVASEEWSQTFARFSDLPKQQLLTLKVSTPEPWVVYASETHGIDTDNIQLEAKGVQGLHIRYALKYLLVSGQCIDVTSSSPPAGMQLELFTGSLLHNTTSSCEVSQEVCKRRLPVSDTLVMQNLGYFQVQAAPGVWEMQLAAGASTEVFQVLSTSGVPLSQLPSTEHEATAYSFAEGNKLRVVVKDFSGRLRQLRVMKRQGMKHVNLLEKLAEVGPVAERPRNGLLGNVLNKVGSLLPHGVQSLLGGEEGMQEAGTKSSQETIHVFSLASGALYERFLRIMMVSVRQSTSGPIKFWLVENFLSPEFKATVPVLAEAYQFEYELVTYKWPHWLRGQTEKQRIIWGYKILFLDVLFPLDVAKVIYVDADQVVRADLRELWDTDLHGRAYGYTPFCDSREETLGFQFWRSGYWNDHLRGRPYHISALYVVDLLVFRQQMVGDRLRALYDQLSRDPNSLSNLDQDLPNYAQHMIPIWSLPQEWLWCESWCSDASKATAKTIDLCNNPLHKEPKLEMAKRVISGNLFQKSWVELDADISVVIQDAGKE